MAWVVSVLCCLKYHKFNYNRYYPPAIQHITVIGFNVHSVHKSSVRNPYDRHRLNRLKALPIRIRIRTWEILRMNTKFYNSIVAGLCQWFTWFEICITRCLRAVRVKRLTGVFPFLTTMSHDYLRYAAVKYVCTPERHTVICRRGIRRLFPMRFSLGSVDRSFIFSVLPPPLPRPSEQTNGPRRFPRIAQEFPANYVCLRNAF